MEDDAIEDGVVRIGYWTSAGVIGVLVGPDIELMTLRAPGAVWIVVINGTLATECSSASLVNVVADLLLFVANLDANVLISSCRRISLLSWVFFWLEWTWTWTWSPWIKRFKKILLMTHHDQVVSPGGFSTFSMLMSKIDLKRLIGDGIEYRAGVAGLGSRNK